jgi:hypothetical protein
MASGIHKAQAQEQLRILQYEECYYVTLNLRSRVVTLYKLIVVFPTSDAKKFRN